MCARCRGDDNTKRCPFEGVWYGGLMKTDGSIGEVIEFNACLAKDPRDWRWWWCCKARLKSDIDDFLVPLLPRAAIRAAGRARRFLPQCWALCFLASEGLVQATMRAEKEYQRSKVDRTEGAVYRSGKNGRRRRPGT